MIITIQHNEKEREYEGTSCVYSVVSGDKISGALIGEPADLVYMLLRLIEGFFDQADLFGKITFIHMITELINDYGGEEEAC